MAAYLRDKDADAVIKQLQAQHSRFSMLEARLPQPTPLLRSRRPSRACCSSARGYRSSCLS